MSFHCQGCPPYDWVPVDVSSFNIDGDEQMGTKEKFWLRSQEKDERWLWKQARNKDGFTRGEDWAECLEGYSGIAPSVTSPLVNLGLSGT